MSRYISLIVALVCLVCCVIATAAEPVRTPAPRGQTTAPAGRRFDLQKFREAREKRGQGAADNSKLKTMTWTVGGTTREALVYVPATPSESPPVVFAFHGHGGNETYSARKFDIHDLWPEAVCVYPQGLPTPSPQIDPDGKKSGWQKSIGDQNDRDLEFFDAMLKTVKADYHVDEKRVYVMGHSNGGFFAYVLWCARGDEIAAFAPIAADLDVKDMKLMKPKPVLHVAGENDPLVKFPGQQKTIEADRKLNGCDPDGKPAGDLCTEYTSKTGPPVIAFIHPGGHEVPEGARKRIVDFFKSVDAK